MKGKVDLLKLEGSVALFTIQKFKNAEEVCEYINDALDKLEKEGYVKCIFDLQHLNLINSRFIGLIAKRHHALKEKGGSLAILKAQDMAKRSFEMSGLLDILKFYTDQEEAINGMKG